MTRQAADAAQLKAALLSELPGPTEPGTLDDAVATVLADRDDDVCAQVTAWLRRVRRPADGAEMAARRTAAAALRADFESESYAYAMQGAAVPDWVTWAQRLSLALAGLLGGDR